MPMSDPDLRKALIDRLNGRLPDGQPAPDLGDSWLAERKGETYVFSWATVSGEIDMTHQVKEARRLWLWYFRAPAALREPCRTSLKVISSKPYRLNDGGRTQPQVDVLFSISASNQFAKRYDWEIVDILNTFAERAEYRCEGEAVVGKRPHPVLKTVYLL